jgi:hypothetical protein
MKPLALVAVALVALAVPANGEAALYFLFDRPSGVPNELVTVRTGATPRRFALDQRVKPYQRPVRLYLLPEALVAQVHSRFDPRLSFLGAIVPDRKGLGLVRFSVPPLDAGAYTIAYWCPGCAASSRGRTFFVQDAEQFTKRYRTQARLRIEATASCPVTLPNGNRPPRQPRNVGWYGNGLLWAGLTADGVDAAPPDRVDPNGAIANKLLWVTTPPTQVPTLAGERIDATAAPLRVLGMNHGSFSSAANPSFMSPVVFPMAGCWRLTARVGDISLTYVVRVVVRQGRQARLSPSRDGRLWRAGPRPRPGQDGRLVAG